MRAPDVYAEIIDESILPSVGIAGLIAFFGVTELGSHTRPVVVGSWEDFQDNFGGLITESNFPLYAKRALDNGAKLLVARAVHYTNPMDASTLTGTKATMTKTVGSPVTAVRATATLTLTNAGAANDKITVLVLGAGGSPILLGTATSAVSETVTTLAAKVVSAINLNTATTGYSAANTAGVVTITAPVGSGATANGYVLSNAATGTIAYSQTAFASGVTAQAVVSLTLTAATIGAWGNKLTAYATAAASGLANTFDLTISYADNSRIVNVVTDIPVNPTQSQIDSYNALLTWAQITSITTMAAFGSTAFTSGAEDKTLISTMDYIGDQTAGTGFYVFDDSGDPIKIAVPDIVDPLVNQALANYVDMRKDMVALTRTPIGITAAGAVDFRKGQGAFAGNPAIDSWRTFMFTGGLTVIHPVTGKKINIGELGDIAYIASNKDNSSFPWMSLAGAQRGKLKQVQAVVNNVGTPARRTQFQLLSNNGVNAIINDRTEGIVLWDNVTLGKDTLLKHANVAELMIYIYRTIIPLARSKMFEPNNPKTWKEIWRRVENAMKYVKDNEGVYDYKYVGDQFAETIAQAEVNTSITVDQGIYIFKLYVKPTPAMREIEIKIIVSNSDVDFSTVG